MSGITMKRQQKLFNNLNSVGDTIVEVLIVLAVLSLAFAIASATASRGLSQSRNAEEHSQALGLLSSQIEQLRTAVANHSNQPFATPGIAFCMVNASTIVPFTGGADIDDLSSYPSACVPTTSNGFYHVSGVLNGNNTFTFRVRWDGIGSLGRQQELMEYRVNPLTQSVNPNIILTDQTNKVVITAQQIPPTGDVYNLIPACSLPASWAISGVNTSLQNGQLPYSQSQNTGAGTGVALYDNLKGPFQYLASAGIPGGYQACPDSSKGQSVSAGRINQPINVSGSASVNVKFTPVCTAGARTRDFVGRYSDPPYRHWSPPYRHWSPPYNHYGPNDVVLWWAHNGNGRPPAFGYANDSFPAYSFYTYEGGTDLAHLVYYEYHPEFPHHSTGWYYVRYTPGAIGKPLLGSWSDDLGIYPDDWGVYSDPPVDHWSPYYDTKICNGVTYKGPFL
jgi:type II secretory pathway pseudopilin PulG